MAAPLYQTVIDQIIAKIARGELLPGAMLPSETQLAADCGVSQGTARKSLMELEKLGIVRREQGRGSFVTARTPDSALFNFFRLRAPDGTLIRPSLLREELRRRVATAVERRALDGAPEEVFEITRLRALNGTPSVLETAVVSAQRFAGLESRAPLPNTLYVLYQQSYGCIILRTDETLTAIAAEPDHARALKIAPGTPILCVERIGYDVLGRGVERRQSLCRTDTYAYHVSLT